MQKYKFIHEADHRHGFIAGAAVVYMNFGFNDFFPCGKSEFGAGDLSYVFGRFVWIANKELISQ